jgi:hypothetical protein
MPPTLTRRPVRSPVPLWTWVLLHRADDTRPVVARATRTLIDHASAFGGGEHPRQNRTGRQAARRRLDANRRGRHAKTAMGNIEGMINLMTRGSDG